MWGQGRYSTKFFLVLEKMFLSPGKCISEINHYQASKDGLSLNEYRKVHSELWIYQENYQFTLVNEKHILCVFATQKLQRWSLSTLSSFGFCPLFLQFFLYLCFLLSFLIFSNDKSIRSFLYCFTTSQGSIYFFWSFLSIFSDGIISIVLSLSSITHSSVVAII